MSYDYLPLKGTSLREHMHSVDPQDDCRRECRQKGSFWDVLASQLIFLSSSEILHISLLSETYYISCSEKQVDLRPSASSDLDSMPSTAQKGVVRHTGL